MIPALLRYAAVIFIAAVLGAAALYYNFGPGVQWRAAFRGLDAWQLERRQLSSKFNGGAVFRVAHDKGGVTHWDPDKAFDGYTLLATAHGTTVNLVDMSGAVVHGWDLPYMDIWDASSQVQEPVPERFIFVRKARMEPNGDLLVSFSAWATTPHGYGIAKFDKDSTELWSNLRFIHHSFDQIDGGEIYALDHEIATEAPPYLRDWRVPYLDDGISVFSPEGEFIERFSFFDSFYNSPYAPVLTAVAANPGNQGLGNYLHSNDVEILSDDLAESFPMAQAGDLLVSFRELDGIAILDGQTRTVKWFTRGDWRRQHDADFLANGNILLFDNIGMRLAANGGHRSRVIEFNPVNMSVEWVWPDDDAPPFYSNSRASQQRLPNGNTLITESNSGRVIEVTREGELVWEWFNPVRLGDAGNFIPAVFWATRYSEKDIEFELAGS